MERDAQLRAEILKLVEKYYQERFAGHPFNPGMDPVHLCQLKHPERSRKVLPGHNPLGKPHVLTTLNMLAPLS